MFLFTTPLVFFLLSFGFLFYILSQRVLLLETSGYRVSGNLVLFLGLCLGFVSLVTILTWHSPTFFLFQGHLFITESVLSCFCLLLLLSLVVSFLPLFSALFFVLSEAALLSIWSVFFLCFLLGLLFVVTNLYTLIFVVEFVNLLVFFLLILISPNQRDRLTTSPTSPTILFFWINALSSILFFLLLLLFSRFGWFSLFTQSDSFILDTSSFFLTDGFLLFSFFLIVLVFFLKLGLPPFIFWKLRIFESASFWFMALYSVPYFLFVLTILLNLLVFLYTTLTVDNYFFLFFFFFIYGMLLPLVFFAPNVAYFLAVSSGLTVIFLLMFFFLNTSSMDSLTVSTLSISGLYLYLFVYSTLILALLILFESLTVVNKSGAKVFGGDTSLTVFALRGTTDQRLIFRYQLFVVLLNLAGLPPFLVFFLKLRVIVEFFSSSFSYIPLVLLIVSYLFFSIYYYYRIVRLIVSPIGVLQLTKSKTKTALIKFFNTPGVKTQNCVILFLRTAALTIFYILCFLSFGLLLDFFIFFTSNWPF